MVFKIVPMEGDTLVNGEPQKRAAEMLAEVEIALALSALRGPLGVPQNCDLYLLSASLQQTRGRTPLVLRSPSPPCAAPRVSKP